MLQKKSLLGWTRLGRLVSTALALSSTCLAQCRLDIDKAALLLAHIKSMVLSEMGCPLSCWTSSNDPQRGHHWDKLARQKVGNQNPLSEINVGMRLARLSLLFPLSPTSLQIKSLNKLESAFNISLASFYKFYPIFLTMHTFKFFSLLYFSVI